MGSETSSALLGIVAFPGQSDGAPAEVALQTVRPQTDLRLEGILRSEFRIMWRAVRRLGVPQSLADDATQEVFIIFARKLDEVVVGQERRYLFGVALRVAANIRRGLATRREATDSHALSRHVSQLPSPDVLVEQKRMRELLDLVLEGMTEELRTTFVLFEFEEFSMREIAELLEIPEGTVASRLRRAREIFQARVAHLKSDRNARGVP